MTRRRRSSASLTKPISAGTGSVAAAAPDLRLLRPAPRDDELDPVGVAGSADALDGDVEPLLAREPAHREHEELSAVPLVPLERLGAQAGRDPVRDHLGGRSQPVGPELLEREAARAHHRRRSDRRACARRAGTSSRRVAASGGRCCRAGSRAARGTPTRAACRLHSRSPQRASRARRETARGPRPRAGTGPRASGAAEPRRRTPSRASPRRRSAGRRPGARRSRRPGRPPRRP